MTIVGILFFFSLTGAFLIINSGIATTHQINITVVVGISFFFYLHSQMLIDIVLIYICTYKVSQKKEHDYSYAMICDVIEYMDKKQRVFWFMYKKEKKIIKKQFKF